MSQSQVVNVQFRGMDQAADPKAQPVGTLVRADNCVMDKARRLKKRRGTASYSKAATIGYAAAHAVAPSAGKRLMSRGQDLIVNDGVYAFSRQAAFSAWDVIGKPSPLSMRRRTYLDVTRSAGAVDTVLIGDLLVTAFMSGYSIAYGSMLHFQIEDAETGTKIVPPTMVASASATAMRLMKANGKFWLVWTESNGNVNVFGYDTTTLSVALGPTLLTSDGSLSTTLPVLDARLVSSAVWGEDVMYFAYGLQTAVGGKKVRARGWKLGTHAFIPNGPYILGVLGVSPLCVAVACDGGGKIAFAGSDVGSSTRVESFDESLTLVSAVSTITNAGYCVSIAMDFYDSTHLLVSRIVGNAATALHQYLASDLVAFTGHAQSMTLQKTFHAQGISRLFRVGTGWYQVATFFPRELSLLSTGTLTQASTVVIAIEPSAGSGLEGDTHRHVGTCENQTGWLSTPVAFCQQPGVHLDSDGNPDGLVYIPSAYRNREPTNLQAIPVGWDLQRISVGDDDSLRLVPTGLGGLGASGAPFWYDGQQIKPYGFAHAPMIATSPAGFGVGSVAAGTYFYLFVYEWKDANGVLHRSAPSPARSVVAAGGTGIRMTVATSCLSHPRIASTTDVLASPIELVAYRTTANGSTYYRLSLEPSFQVLVNDTSVGEVAFTDTKADADIADANPARLLNVQPQVYTASGELADVPPPAARTVVRHGGRLALVDSTGLTVWLTKDQSEDPQVAPGFNEALTLSFPRTIYALASLDEKLIAYGADEITVIHGDGPDATGAGAWQKQVLQSDVGCVNPKSVAVCPSGSVFLSSRGIELLSRDLTVTWIGKAAEDILAAYPVITSAVLVAVDHEVRFTCTTRDGSHGVVLAWDYFHQAWLTRTYADVADTAIVAVAFVDAALINGVYTMLTATGQVYVETDAHKMDNGTQFVESDIELAWFSPVGPMNWHRVKDVGLLGTSVTDHDLEVSIARDYATTYEQVKTFAATTAPVAVGPLSKCRVTFKNQQGRAFKLRIKDKAPSAGVVGTGDGPIFEGLAFRVAPKSGLARTTKAEQG
jgi:hypothetical protein